MPYLFLIAAFVCNGAANILLKEGALHGFGMSSKNPVFFLAHNWEVATGLLLFSVNALFYLFALKTLPLSVAYPVMVGMTFLIVGVYAAIFLGEHISIIHILGYVSILFGVLLIVSRV